jgi:hypothetical protein
MLFFVYTNEIISLLKTNLYTKNFL